MPPQAAGRGGASGSSSLEAGARLFGFRIERVREVGDIQAVCTEAVHERTGARLCHVARADEENLFAVGFPTYPTDDTGVAHVLEHSVLAGSDRFPVRDAFQELQKRSLHTFLNAMTWPDRTVYPVCSAVPKDLFHLAEVYLDLVFRPRLLRETFLQEGHHLELSEADPERLEANGVVFNEMKGVYGSAESLFRRRLQQRLLPDTIYAADSGGDPPAILDLTHEALCAFHRRFYTPANARFLVYGDIPLSDHLAFLDERLEGLPPGSPPPPAALGQPRWTEPRDAEIELPLAEDEDAAERAICVLGWRLNETRDTETTLLLDVLAEALWGTAAGPVRKALIESHLGSDTFPGGAYQADGFDATCAFGLRGTNADRAEEVERVVMDALSKVVSEGLDPELLEAAFHQIEHAGRAIVPPFPLMILYRVVPPWFYAGDPLPGLAFGELVVRVRERAAREPRLFEELCARWFVQNPHRLRLAGRPRADLHERRAAEIEARLAERQAELTDADRDRIADEAAALRARQRAPEDPEAVASLPQLAPEDIPDRLLSVPTERATRGGVSISEHPVFSNGIGYVGLSFDVSDLPPALQLYLPLFGRATAGMGAAGLGYEPMATRIARTAGDLRPDQVAGRRVGQPDDAPGFARFLLDAEALARNATPLADLLRDVLVEPDPTDLDRLSDLVHELDTRLQASLVPSGHSYAFRRAASGFGRHQRLREAWGGLAQVSFARRLAAAIRDKARLGLLALEIFQLQRALFCRSRLEVSLAGDPAAVDRLRPEIDRLVAALPAEPRAALPEAGPEALAVTARAESELSGVPISSAVSYAAGVMRVPDLSWEGAPALELLAHVLDGELCYQRIRVEGGAYGGFSFYALDDGLLALLSYRDPDPVRSLGVFAEAPRFAASDKLTRDAIESVRLGTIGDFDRILSPGQKLGAARRRGWTGLTEEARARFRRGILSHGIDEVRAFAVGALEAALPTLRRVALGPRDVLEAGLTTFPTLQIEPLSLDTTP